MLERSTHIVKKIELSIFRNKRFVKKTHNCYMFSTICNVFMAKLQSLLYSFECL